MKSKIFRIAIKKGRKIIDIVAIFPKGVFLASYFLSAAIDKC